MFKKAEELQKNFTNKKLEELQVGNYSLTIKGRLAEGGFGFIDIATDNLTRVDYVLKRCSVSLPEYMDTVKKEVYVLQLFESPNIVKLFATDFINRVGTREALLLLEYCPGGHLLDRLMKREGRLIPEKTVCKFFCQLLNALRCLHNHDPYIVHRDIKLENILIAADGSLRLCDFGSCVFGTVYMRNPTERSEAESAILKETTPMYRAPELVDLYMREELNEKTDIWALGCIFYAMCFLKLPFNEGETLRVLSDKINYPRMEGVSESCYILMKRMLDFIPEARPSVDELSDACLHLIDGQPLPDYHISDIAMERRTQRQLAANKAPPPKIVKKVPEAVIPARAAVPTGPSSAAAKRLAQMKGGGGGTGLINTIPAGTTSYDSASYTAPAAQYSQPSALSHQLSNVSNNAPFSAKSSAGFDFDFSSSSKSLTPPPDSGFESFEHVSSSSGAHDIDFDNPFGLSPSKVVNGFDTGAPTAPPNSRVASLDQRSRGDFDSFSSHVVAKHCATDIMSFPDNPPNSRVVSLDKPVIPPPTVAAADTSTFDFFDSDFSPCPPLHASPSKSALPPSYSDQQQQVFNNVEKSRSQITPSHSRPNSTPVSRQSSNLLPSSTARPAFELDLMNMDANSAVNLNQNVASLLDMPMSPSNSNSNKAHEVLSLFDDSSSSSDPFVHSLQQPPAKPPKPSSAFASFENKNTDPRDSFKFI